MTSRLRIWARRVLVLGLLLGTSPAHAQVSPGPLAAPHAALDGSTRCLQCHVTGGQKAGMDARCLACHGEIAWLRTQQRGPHAAVAAKACAGCHPDHGGRDFQMIAWDGGRPEAFDHRRSGFALEGRHAAVACRTCHAPAFQKSPVTARLRRRDASRSWLGLERACASCHEDVHRGQLGADCRRCHDAQAWTPARGFDHARTAYPLTGAHATLACTSCHTVLPGVTTAAGKPVLRWSARLHEQRHERRDHCE